MTGSKQALEVMEEFKAMIRTADGELKPGAKLVVEAMKEFEIDVTELAEDELDKIFAYLIIASRDPSGAVAVNT
ncbi:hypothetical protein SPSIL_020130 [Sporomusa silvacetica DSM 10669]|uniref:Uncharacterized protein n=1 Tax=Sporomusa silvacetica DSM 10669 TaxID=1123289 RepID=A0ABZ3IJN6_9FIRM|nr:hypothetical protein [Sporomusa silvacetica]OZC18734.1 hypothetical protein SPSIL_23430 [Sporomusa silvacetica DSM 10669]